MNIRKAVVPAAGLGTRFLPATKTVPKEMFPIVDKPILFYLAQELVDSGIEELVLITSRSKNAIEDFFKVSPELESLLDKTGKADLLGPLRELRKRLKVTSVLQDQPLGLGHAVLCGQAAVGAEPFAVLLGDELMITKPGRAPATGQLMALHTESGQSAVAVMEVAAEEVNKYGIVSVKPKAPLLWTVEKVVEKPAVGQAPSRLALPGRYVFTPGIFTCLKEIKPGRNGEIQLTDAMTLLAQREGMLATVVDALRFDAGDKLGFMQANVELALQHPEIGPAFKVYLQERFGG